MNHHKSDLFVLLFIILMATFSSCIVSTPDAETPPAVTEQEMKSIIDNLNTKLESWYRQGLVDSVATVFADNCVQLPPNAEPIRGADDFKARWSEILAITNWDFDFEVQEVRVEGDMAVELGKYSLHVTPKGDSGIPEMTDKGNYLVLWQKTDGEWQILWDAPVSEMPPPGSQGESPSE